MTIFFTSDTHFGHRAIIKLSERPFETVEDMDAELIARWNATVTPSDTVYHLGDFSYRAAVSPDRYRRRLNGEIHLVVGNHDRATVPAHADLFASVSTLKEVTVERQRIVLCHYPMREWPGAFRAAWHLFGHVHGGYEGAPWGYSMDVGVDARDYRPIAFTEVERIMAARTNPFVGERRLVSPTLWDARRDAGDV